MHTINRFVSFFIYQVFGLLFLALAVAAHPQAVIDLFQNSTSTDNCVVAPVLKSSCISNTLRFSAPCAPNICLPETSFAKGLTSQEKQKNNIMRYPNTTSIALQAKQAIVMSFSTGTVLLEKNAYEQMVPASMTKMMTAYLIQEKIKKGEFSFDAQFLVNEKAWRMGGTTSFMPLGKMVSLKDILYGIIIHSGNDAAVVAAEGLYGSEEHCVEAMNARGRELGMNGTHFVNASGWPAEHHYSTAYDLALLGSALIKDYPEFYSIYSQKQFTFGKDRKGIPITQANRNPLLYKNVGCDGIKTGATDVGGYGVVASFVDNAYRYVMVLNGLDSMKQRSDESLKLLHWVKQNFVNKKMYAKGDEVGETTVAYGVKDRVKIVVAEDVSLFVTRAQENKIDVKIDFLPSVRAPIQAGDTVGKLLIMSEHTTQVIPLLAQESIAKLDFCKRIAAYFKSICKGLFSKSV